MREDQKREFEDTKLVQDFLRAAKQNFGEKQVDFNRDSNGTLTIKISDGTKTVTRKQHTHECYHRVGD